MNNDLISREAMKKLFARVKWVNKADGEAAVYLVESAPAVDAVEVVRCKDCKYYKKGSCELHSVWPDEYSTGYDYRPDDDDFCSYGERRETNG